MITQRSWLRFGHYLLNDKYCARDWIDTKDIIETKQIMFKINEVIVRDIYSKFRDNYLIVGIDETGVLLASRIAFSLQKPFSYVVSEKEIKHNAQNEIRFEDINNIPVILITDAIVTFNTIQSVIKKYHLSERVVQIYTILYRPNSSDEDVMELIEKTTCLNSDFRIELFPKVNCIYRSNRCVACNNRE